MPLNPRNAAIKATTKNMSAQYNMVFSLPKGTLN
jgi:hypothetical protein